MFTFFFIADEVHELGSKVRRKKVFFFNPKYRLGLTATPSRYFDEEGTEFLEKYFNGTIFQYTLSDAINNGDLCEYDYYPVFCELDEGEKKRFSYYTQQIAIETDKKDTDLQKVEDLLNRRSKVIKKAKEKGNKIIETYKDIGRKKNSRIKHMLIYLEDEEQLESAKQSLISNDIIPGIITQKTPKKKSERYKVIEDLKKGKIPFKNGGQYQCC